MNAQNTPPLETERLRLRRFTENDIEALFAIFRDEEVNTYLPWFPLKTWNDAVIFFREKYDDIYKQEKGYRYAVCLKTNNTPIGYANVSMDDSHDFGYGLKKDFWHNGITSEACKAILEQVKKDQILYVTATHDVQNDRSGKVMKNIGMTYKYSFKELCQPKNVLTIFRMYQINFDEKNDRIYKKYWNNSSFHFVERTV